MLRSFIWRFIRTAAGLGLAAAISWAAKDPRWIWLTPVISAIAKVLREKFGLTNIPF